MDLNNSFLPLVSIIIPVYNGSNFLKEAIDSALSQTYSNIEIIVVNDGSTDNGKTRNIALSYNTKIRYFEKTNGGVSSALNLGISKMRGEYFSWLSHDDIYLPTKIQASIEALSKSEDKTLSVLCNSDYLLMPERSVKKHSVTYNEELLKFGIYALLCGPAMGCTLLIHRSYFIKYGLFDLTRKTTQDYFQWFTFYKENNLIYLSEPLVHIRIHSEQGSRTETIMPEEENELYSYIANNIPIDGIVPLNWNLYQCLSILFFRQFNFKYASALKNIANKMKQLITFDDKNNDDFDFKSLIKRNSRVILYCAGKRFRKVAFNFLSRGIAISGFSDSNVKLLESSINGIHPLLPDDLNKETDCIIITKENPSDVKNSLIGQGFKHVYTYDEDFFPLFIEIPIKKEFLDEYEKWL